MLHAICGRFGHASIVGARSLQPRPQFATMLLVALTVTAAAHIAPCADDACIRRALSADAHDNGAGYKRLRRSIGRLALAAAVHVAERSLT